MHAASVQAGLSVNWCWSRKLICVLFPALLLQIVAVQEKVAEATEDIHVPPAEIPTNTEDLLRQRHMQ